MLVRRPGPSRLLARCCEVSLLQYLLLAQALPLLLLPLLLSPHGAHRLPTTANQPIPSCPPVCTVELLFGGEGAQEAIARGAALASGALFTRWLVEAPPNVCTPRYGLLVGWGVRLCMLEVKFGGLGWGSQRLHEASPPAPPDANPCNLPPPPITSTLPRSHVQLPG